MHKIKINKIKKCLTQPLQYLVARLIGLLPIDTQPRPSISNTQLRRSEGPDNH